jgi:hypothetical protein
MFDWNSLRMTRAGRIPPAIWNALVAKIRGATIESILGGKLSRYPDGGTTLEIDLSSLGTASVPLAPLTLTTETRRKA